MFDPLDLYTPDEAERHTGENSNICSSPNLVSKQVRYFDNDQSSRVNDSDDDSAVDILDLPPARFAPPQVILCVLLLLQPSSQVNFCNESSSPTVSVSDVCGEKRISKELLNEVVTFYNTDWQNSRLNTPFKVCSRVPALAKAHGGSILTYYTSLLKFYESLPADNSLRDEIIKQVSLRIAENCGRTAQPAMSRKFTFENLRRPIVIYEPSLTADNLGWKTWGSSFILAQKLIDRLDSLTFHPKLRILELGSGTGLAGISWLSKWTQLHGGDGAEMFLTDLPAIVPNLLKNVEANGLNDYATVSVLDWTDPSKFVDSFTDRKFDILIVSDPIYSPNHPELVVDMIKKFLVAKGKCYLEIPLRDKYASERERLRQLIDENKLAVVYEEVDQGMEDWGVVNYQFQEIKWK